MRSIPIVDAHQHFWDLGANHYPWLTDSPVNFRYGDYSAICRDYGPDDYRRDAAAWNLVGSVHIEAESDPADPVAETRWLHGLADAGGLPKAIVAQAWLDREDAADILRAQAGFPLVRGIRHKPYAAATPDTAIRDAKGSMDDPGWRRGFALLAQHKLSFDLQTPYWHMPAAADLAGDFPDTQIIINHTGMPADRSEQRLADWRVAMETVAAQPNVALKISGLGQPGQPWTTRANGPIVRDAISIFGTDRCMFASNFPVDSLVAGYNTIFGGFMEIVSDFPDEAVRALFRDNAVRYYRIDL